MESWGKGWKLKGRSQEGIEKLKISNRPPMYSDRVVSGSQTPQDTKYWCGMWLPEWECKYVLGQFGGPCLASLWIAKFGPLAWSYEIKTQENERIYFIQDSCTIYAKLYTNQAIKVGEISKFAHKEMWFAWASPSGRLTVAKSQVC